MARTENEQFAKRVVHYCLNQADRQKSLTVQHFQQEGIARSTIYTILQRFEATKSLAYKKIPGKPATQATPKVLNAISKMFEKNPSLSVRAAARRLNIAKSTLSDIKIKKLGIKARVKQKAPKYIKQQKERAKTACRKIYKSGLRKILVLDDETYVPIDPADIPKREFFHCSDPSKVSYDDKVKQRAKFAKKYLVWLAISENGQISDPFITDQNITSQVYLTECIKRRLIPFIQGIGKNDVLFWPDLATVHYGKIVTSFLNTENISFVHKNENAPNVPQARGIERFWALCKEEYSKRKTPPKNLNGFKSLQNNCAKSGREVRKSCYGQCMEETSRNRLP
ncbi:hypothetical protein Zmor_023572 [Zophobas morio]|uniref:Transposase n=1 Tax=Zophobas morio TaxID=2755281 RepID=A0AA38HXI9_9CUCU|nr:hypothetical protein Zmor_023572 [Zophobas morio]